MRRALHVAALAVALAATPAAQGRLQIRSAVTADTPGNTAGMDRQSVATAPDREVWVGDAVLDLPPTSIQTVGLEVDADGATALSLWLSEPAAAAFADLTEASVGRALAVVWDGRVLTAPVVEAPIRNGMVMITGLGAAEAERLADALRQASERPVAAFPDREDLPNAPKDRPAARPAVGWSSAPSDTPERPPMRFDPPSGISEPAASPGPSPAGTRLVPPSSTAGSASAAARSFAAALTRRDWRTAAAALHPDALDAVRQAAGDRLRLDGTLAVLRDGEREASVEAADVLGRAPQSLDRLDDPDRAALYLAGLEALGSLPLFDAPQEVVAEVPDGRRVHVLMRAATDTPGVSQTTAITLAPDASGAWRPLLPSSRRL